MLHNQKPEKFRDPEKLFFTADTHFNHENILKYCPNRNCLDVNEMNGRIVEQWNAIVPDDGIVFHLGDVGFGSIETIEQHLNRLNGKIILIRGNHDSAEIMSSTRFENVYDYMYISVVPEGADFFLCHYPMRTWNQSHRGSINLFGHCHGTLPDDPNLLQMDVGVDTNSLKVYTYWEIVKNMWHKSQHKPRS